MAGRPKLPSKTKQLRGTDQPCRMNDQEPLPDILVSAPCPPHLVEDDVARQTWEEVVPLLIGMRVLAASDLQTVEQYCDVVSDLRATREMIKEHGRIIYEVKMDSTGGEYVVAKANPAVVQNKALLLEFRALSNLLGLNPSARASLKVEPQKPNEDDGMFDV